MTDVIYCPCFQPLFREYGLLDWTQVERHNFVAGLLGYMLQAHDFNTMARLMPRLKRPQCSALRKLIMEDVNWAVRLKLALCRALQKQASPAKAGRLFIQAGLHPNDAGLATFCESRGFGQSVRARLRWKTPTPAMAFARCERLLEQNRTFIEKYSYKKLRFIATSNNMGDNNARRMIDIHNDLRCKMIQTYYWSIPFKSRLHARNSMRNSMVNEGTNLINYYTAAKRGRLRRTEDGGWENIIQTDQVMKDGDVFSIMDQIASDEPFVAHEMHLAVHQLYEQADVRIRHFLDLMAQKEDRPFVQWYNHRHGCRTSSIDGAYAHAFRQGIDFAREAARYLGYKPREFRLILGSLRTKLGGDVEWAQAA